MTSKTKPNRIYATLLFYTVRFDLSRSISQIVCVFHLLLCSVSAMAGSKAMKTKTQRKFAMKLAMKAVAFKAMKSMKATKSTRKPVLKRPGAAKTAGKNTHSDTKDADDDDNDDEEDEEEEEEENEEEEEEDERMNGGASAAKRAAIDWAKRKSNGEKPIKSTAVTQFFKDEIKRLDVASGTLAHSTRYNEAGGNKAKEVIQMQIALDRAGYDAEMKLLEHDYRGSERQLNLTTGWMDLWRIADVENIPQAMPVDERAALALEMVESEGATERPHSNKALKAKGYKEYEWTAGGKETRLKEKRGQLVGFQRSMLVDKEVQKDQRKGIRDEMDNDFARSSAGAGNPVLGESKQKKPRKTKEEKEEEKREARN